MLMKPRSIAAPLLCALLFSCAEEPALESSYSLADDIDAHFDRFLKDPWPDELDGHALAGGLPELLVYQQPGLDLDGTTQENFNQWVHTAWIAVRLFGTAPVFKVGQFAEDVANTLLGHLGLGVDIISDDPLGETFVQYTRLQEVAPYDRNARYCGGPGQARCPLPTERVPTHGPGYSWATEEHFHIADLSAGAWVELDERNQESFIEGRECPLDDKGLLAMIEQVIVEEWTTNNLAPSVGQFHEWSNLPPLPPFLDFYDSGSKLLSCLAVGCTSKYLTTGQEGALIDWFLLEFQPQPGGNKADLQQVFRKSYQLNDGNIYLTLLTIENVLSRYWLDMNRSDREINHRLLPLTAVYRDKGDKFGAWYHFVGAMIASFYSTQEHWNAFILFMEDASSRFLYSEGDEFQEGCVNHSGGQVGFWLRQDMESNINRAQKTFGALPIENDSSLYDRNPGFQYDPASLHRSRYLRLDQEYRGRIEVYTAPELHAELTPAVDAEGYDLTVTSRVRGLTGCALDLMLPHPSEDEFFLHSRGEPVVLPLGQPRGHRVAIPDGLRRDRFRVFVSGCTSNDPGKPFTYPLAFDSGCPTLLSDPTQAVPYCPAP